MTASTRREHCKPPDELTSLSDGLQKHDNSRDVMYDVRSILSRLEPALRAVAEARWLDGMTRKEIQDRLGLTKWEAWKRERQAREFLKGAWA